MLGVLHRVIPRDDGRFYYVVRVPPSPLAPHMVTSGRHKYRFLRTGNVTDDSLNTRQIKENALRTETAFDRAMSRIQERSRRLLEYASKRHDFSTPTAALPKDQAALHVLPLFSAPQPWDFTDQGLVRRLGNVKALGASTTYDEARYTDEGTYFRMEGMRHVPFLRSGGLEFQTFDVVRTRSNDGQDILRAWEFEQDVVEALESAVSLTEDGLIPLPRLLRLALFEIAGSRLAVGPRGRDLSRPYEEDSLQLEPVLVSGGGGEASRKIRQMFNELWQAWGYPRSLNYDNAGSRMWFAEPGNRIRRESRF